MGVIVETSKGKLEGVRKGDLCVFRGVPFAQPPVGDLRYRGPRPVDAWSGVLDATSVGPRAMQVPNELFETVLGRAPKQPPMDEDCLNLNVWTPGLDGGRRPVMVWIHGGGFTIGAGSEPLYNGAFLASRGDVVVVTINYRLGAFGFLYMADFADKEGEPCANFGMLDQVAALEWVRDEIAAFGGDPDNVTVFGESAGAMAVGILMASPAASGLFRRAIMQSGAARFVFNIDQAQAAAAGFAEALGIEELTAARLRSLPAEDILRAQASVEAADRKRMREGPAALRFQPAVDGLFLRERPIDAVRSGLSKDVSLLIGTTAEEWKLFAAMVPGASKIEEDEAARRIGALVSPGGDTERGRTILRSYRDARQARGQATSPYEILVAAQTDFMARVPSDQVAEAQAAHQRQVFTYRFDWPSPIANGRLGACHAIDLPFVFGTQKLVPVFAGEGPDADALAATVGDAWLAFARTGDPSTDSLPWPSFEAKRRSTMILDRQCRVEELPAEAERCCWDGIIT